MSKIRFIEASTQTSYQRIVLWLLLEESEGWVASAGARMMGRYIHQDTEGIRSLEA
jgi:hypothetical protein